MGDSQQTVQNESSAGAANGIQQQPQHNDHTQEQEPSVTKTERLMLRRDWSKLKPHIPNIGVVTFLYLFDRHKDVHKAFTEFRHIETSQLRYNSALRSHALRVMGIVETCIAHLDDRDKLKERMTELGQKHGSFGTVQVSFMDLMGPQAIEAIEPHLKEQGCWDKEHEAAWENLFKLMAYHMKRGIANA